MKAKGKESRELGGLISIGPAMLRDFRLLGVRSVAQLAGQDPEKMYRRLGWVARQHQDICVLDTFRAAVAQARDPRLPAEQCQWWCWSGQRKTAKNGSPQGTQRSQNSERKTNRDE